MMTSLLGRLVVILTLLTLSAAALLMFFVGRSERMHTDQVQQALHREMAANMVADNPLLSEGEVAKSSLGNAFHSLMLLGPAFEIYATDTTGKIRAYSGELGLVKQSEIELAPVHQFLVGADLPLYGTDPRNPARRQVFSAAAIKDATGVLRGYLYVIVGGSKQSELESISAGKLRQDQALLFTVGALFLALLASGLMFGLLTRPLAALSRAMQAFRQGGLGRSAIGRHLPGWTSREVLELQGSFVALADTVVDQMDQIRSAEASRRELLDQIAHDLKTPLASLQGYLETWLLHHPEAQDRQHIEIALRNGRVLHRLVEQLLELARLDAGQETLTLEPVVVAELAHDIMAKFALDAQQRGVLLSVNAPVPNLRVAADIAKLERVLANLVDNALRHTPAGGEVRLSILESSEGVLIELRDNGVGIASNNLSRIFEPRYHSDSAAGDHSTHLGLGLAIVQRLLKLHGSQIEVESGAGQGTTFHFNLACA